MDHQQSNNYLITPPTAADPYQRPPQVPPLLQIQSWPYPTNQFHYQIQRSPSPPPPPPQWLSAQSHSSNHAQYSHLPPPHPYPAHQPYSYSAHPHYPPLQPFPFPPRPHVYAQLDVSNGNWSHHQSWDYPTNNNKEDWGEKARAWAVARAVSDNQYPPAGRPEEQNHFHEHSLFVHAPLDQGSSYQQHSLGVGQLKESQYVGSGQLPYSAEMHVPCGVRNGSLPENQYESTSQQEKSSIGPLAYQQEVPSSYSSVSGNAVPVDRYENFSSSSSQHVACMPLLHVQPHVVGRSGWKEEQHHLLSTQPAESSSLSDQPLNFAPHFNRSMDQHTQPNYSLPLGGTIRSLDPTVSMPSNYAWTPSSTSGVDHAISVPSPASGHSAPIFPAGHNFQTTSPLMGASYGVGSGVVSHPTSSFSVEMYGASGVAEHPKKASVPNWLREEIIKNKAVITSSTTLKHPQEDLQSVEEESNDKYSGKGDHTDSKHIDSSRSNENVNDDDDEDVEAARTAAINKEIKRVLTEVLLKVTDELFDEIATKVLNESDLSVEVGQSDSSSNHLVVPSTSTVSTPTASAKILIPTMFLKIDNEDGSEKSTSGSAGDVLGLASYASDEEEEDEIKISGMLNPEENSRHEQSSPNKLLADSVPIGKDSSRKNIEEHENYVANVEDVSRSSINFTSDFTASDVKSNAHMEHELDVNQSGEDSQSLKSWYKSDENDIHGKNRNSAEEVKKKLGHSELMPNKKRDEEHERDHRADVEHKSGTKERREEKGRTGEKTKESESRKRPFLLDEEHSRHDEKHRRTEKNENLTSSEDRGKEKGRIYEKAKDSESKKSLSPLDVKDGRFDTSKDKRTSNKESKHEKRLDKTRDEKKDSSRFKNRNGSSRYKPHRSSVDSWVSTKLTVSCSRDSSDESSEDSRRKSHRSKRHKSPPFIRSRKRQVSRSPHSKHSKLRDTPYSCLETTRGRRSKSRSRSGSPVHRRR